MLRLDFHADEAFQPIKLATERGDVDCRYYRSPSSARNDKEVAIINERQSPPPAAVIFVTGVGGGWGTPAKGLYSRLCNFLSKEHGISAMRIRYRYPTDLLESVFDVLVGITFLKQNEQVRKIGLVGHSFGGAVVLQAAAAASDTVSTVVTLATQSYGATDAVTRLKHGGSSNHVSLLLIHGTKDGVLPVRCSQQIHQMASEPKRLVVFKGAGHGLDEASEEIYKLVYEWLVSYLISI